MRRKLLVFKIALLISLITQQPLLAQSKTKVKKGSVNNLVVQINFNSASKTFEVVKPNKMVGSAGFVELRITNFNPFLYNLNIVEKQGIYQNNEKLSEKATGSVSYAQLNFNLKDLNLNFGTIPGAKATYQKQDIKDVVKKIASTTNSIFQRQAELKRTQAELQAIEEIIQARPDSVRDNRTDEMSQLESRVWQLQNDLDSLTGEKSADEAGLDLLVKESEVASDKLLRYNDKVQGLLADMSNLNKLVSYYRTLTNTNSVDGLAFQVLQERKVSNFTAYFPSWDPKRNVNLSVFLNGLLEQLQMDFLEVSKTYNDAYPTLTDANEKEGLRNNFQKLEVVYNSINFEMYSKLIDLVDKLYLSINQNMFTIPYATRIIDDDADAIYFDLVATPIAAADNGIPLQPVRLSFAVPIVGGAKIDVASGFAFITGLFDRSYRYEKQPSGDYAVVENDNRSLFNPTVVLMANLYRRKTIESQRVGVCFGIGTSDAERLRYLLGVTWMIGRKQRMNFSIGAVGGQVNYADDAVLDKEFSLKEEDLTKPVPLAKPAPFRIGGFLGITFNLTGSNSVFAQRVAGAGK